MLWQQVLMAQMEVPLSIASAFTLETLAGDTHNAWTSVPTDAAGQHVRVEFATALVTSPGCEVLLPFICGPVLTDAFPKMVKDLRHAETGKRGYLVLTATPAEVRGDWVAISTGFSRSHSANTAKCLRVLPGAGNLDVIAV